MSEITRRDHYICALLAGGIPYQLAIMQAAADRAYDEWKDRRMEDGDE